MEVAGPHEEWIRPEAATAAQISAVHTGDHLERVRREGVSAGFDDHEEDWGGTLRTRDYREIGRRVLESAVRRGGGCFAIMEGGYNHRVLGNSVMAFLEGLGGG